MYGMKTKWMGAALLAALIGATGCSKNEDGGDGGDGGGGSNASKLESYAMTPEWINYATAVSSELLDDCIGLWAAWNGPTGDSGRRLGTDRPRLFQQKYGCRRERLRRVHENGRCGQC